MGRNRFEQSSAVELQRIMELLGGKKVVEHRVRSALEAHELLAKGLPAQALLVLMGNLGPLGNSSAFTRAVGASRRTIERWKEKPRAPISTRHSGRAWKLAKIIVKADSVFGSRSEATRWLASPAVALDGRRPIDLLTTPPGNQLVRDLLVQLEHGVYV